MSIPSAAYKYESIPNAIKSSCRTSRFTPTNGSEFTSNSNNVIRLEIKSDGYLTNESYLKFSIRNNSTIPCYLDSYASAVVNRLRVLCNGTVLSDIQSYNALSNMLIASQSSDDFYRLLQTTAGASTGFDANKLVAENFTALAMVTAGAPTGPEITTYRGANPIVASGAWGFNVLEGAGALATLTTNSAGVAVNSSTKFYSIPLISGFLNSSRFIPLSLLGGTGLVIEIFLESNFATVFNAGAAFTGTQTYTISNCEMICKIVEIQDEKSEAMIRGMWQTQGLKIKCSDWQTHYNTIPANQGSATIVIPDRSACLKSLMTVMLHSAPAHNVSGLQSHKFNNSAYQYRIGSVLHPNQEVAVSNLNLLESMSEHLKCLNTGIFNLKSHTYLSPSTWANDVSFDRYATYAMSYDFESYSESPDLFSGIDTATLGLPISLNMRFSTNTPIVVNAVTFAHKDVVYSINPDGTITKFD